jgi:hypothetical protein
MHLLPLGEMRSCIRTDIRFQVPNSCVRDTLLTLALMKTHGNPYDARYDVIRLPGDNDDFGGFYEDAYEDAYVDIDDKPDAATDGGDADADYDDFDLAQSVLNALVRGSTALFVATRLSIAPSYVGQPKPCLGTRLCYLRLISADLLVHTTWLLALPCMCSMASMRSFAVVPSSLFAQRSRSPLRVGIHEACLRLNISHQPNTQAQRSLQPIKRAPSPTRIHSRGWPRLILPKYHIGSR